MKAYIMYDAQNKTKCCYRYWKIDYLDGPGIVQLPNIRDVALAFCENCSKLAYRGDA
jgi:hypothetical protein